MIDDTCDYCFRPFAWRGKATCMNCGLENIRTEVAVKRPMSHIPETAMLAPVVERAIMPQPLPRTPASVVPARPNRKDRRALKTKS